MTNRKVTSRNDNDDNSSSGSEMSIRSSSSAVPLIVLQNLDEVRKMRKEERKSNSRNSKPQKDVIAIDSDDHDDDNIINNLNTSNHQGRTSRNSTKGSERSFKGLDDSIISTKSRSSMKGRYFANPNDDDDGDDVVVVESSKGQRCFRCNQVGHLSAQCPFPPSCHICGSTGHSASNCDESKMFCSLCGRKGHTSRLCPQNINSDERNDGTTSRNSLFSTLSSYGNNNSGNKQKENKKFLVDTRVFAIKPEEMLELEKDAICLKCGKIGHVNCDPITIPANHVTLSCFNCGRQGHTGYQCNSQRMDNIAREAAESLQMVGKLCFVCGKDDHMVRDCPHKKKSRLSSDDFNRQGFPRNNQPSRRTPDHFNDNSNYRKRDRNSRDYKDSRNDYDRYDDGKRRRYSNRYDYNR